MRVTMKSIHQNILGNLNRLTGELSRVNNQISSGKQMSKLSDNPVNLITALGLRTNLSELSQYQKNLTFGDKVITASEDALTEIKSLTMRAKTLALQQVNAPITAANRLNAAQEVRHLFEQSILLGNTQVNGKYIFGGFRTTGYTDAEPAPFVAGFINGYRANGNTLDAINNRLTVAMPAGDIAAGNLAINGTATGAAITDNAGQISGLFMGKAAEAKTAIEGADPTVDVNLTTLYANIPATADAGGDAAPTTFDFDVNGINLVVSVADGTGANGVATALVNAINSVTPQTGVTALVGDGTNGGAINAVVFRNALDGNDTAVDVVMNGTVGEATAGFGTFNQAADATHNTGTISMASATSFTLSSPNNADDTILALLNLGGGNKGFADVTNDGEVVYGPRLGSGELLINGISINTSTDDGLSTVYADASAAAKAKAINDQHLTTGVAAEVTPALITATGAIVSGTLGSGDLTINGYDIFDGASATNADPSTILAQDTDNTLLIAINAKAGATGVTATRDSDGRLLLSAIDGRNVHIETSANGENITQLNGMAPDTPASKVYFGTIHLTSDQPFSLETTPTAYESGLAALGLDGGAVRTGEPNDTGGDGKLSVLSIAKRDDSVRYAGDREQEISIKVGQQSTLSVSKNGQEALVDTGLFTILKNFEIALRAEAYTTVTGIHAATDITIKLDSGDTGLEQQFLAVTDGTITITVNDNNYYPPREMEMIIPVDASEDSPVSVAQKINGIPGLTASWDSEGKLTIASTDPDRYTFDVTDTSNFLELAGINAEQMQIQALDTSIRDLETLMENLTNQISDFGARSNRITVQTQIYSNLHLSNTENLSEQEDTDVMKALMEMKAKEVAYEAALSAAAKSMQLSLVDFL